MVQRRAARFILNRYHNTPSVTSMLQQLDWTTLEQRRENYRLVMLHKLNNNLVVLDTAPYIIPVTRPARTSHAHSYQVPHIDECASNPCVNEGVCNNLIDSFTCDCVGGYDGITCDSDFDECASGPCMSNEDCTDGVNMYTCACSAGYAGTPCEDIDECASGPCMSNEDCTDGVNMYTCACSAGYAGTPCAGTVCATSVNAFRQCLTGGRN
eukprot:XP_011675418.1 PREDICTED: fibropellin-3-like [Strongylocentrotus purpuratus]